MKFTFFSILLLLCFLHTNATDKDSTTNYILPDSVKAIQFMAEINIKTVTTSKEIFVGIKTDVLKFSLESDKSERTVVFEFPKSASIIVAGLNTDASEKGEIEWKYNWELNETYKLLIATTSDSASNYSLYSSYIFLPKENKWKLIGTCKIEGRWNSIQNPAVFKTKIKKGSPDTQFGQVWFQRKNGGWWKMNSDPIQNPVIKLYGHLDSIQQRATEIKMINEAIANGNTDVKENKEDVFYTIMKEGAGKQVALTDTVTVFYKGYLFPNGEVFDQTKDSPISFPLNRLIKGWQIGIPFCKEGGKIKLVIPSDMSYSIRTISPKIPPNSILVFEIEVVEAKSVQ